MVEPGGRAPAPEPLRLVQAFINSIDIEAAAEALGDPEALARWLHDHGLEPGDTPSSADLGRALTLRDALRELAAAHNHLAGDVARATGVLNDAAARARLQPVLGGDGRTTLEAGADGVPAALGTIVARVHEAIADGSWTRLKACENGHCRWAFYDASRNRSSRWCSMAVCGSRAKSRRAYHRERGRP
jgi:predicted RNA-binding Zn ribbon-like protein